MELRNRLVGAVVIIAIGSIVWPILFHDSVEDEKIEFREIPAAPHFEKFVVTKPKDVVPPQPAEPALEENRDEQPAQKDAEAEETDTPAATSTSGSSETTTATNSSSRETTSVLDDRDLPISWIVQVASFEKLENAEKLRKDLSDKGFPAFTQQVKTAKGRAVRVFVGPKLQRSKAEELKQQIDKAFKLDAIIKRFSDQ